MAREEAPWPTCARNTASVSLGTCAARISCRQLLPRLRRQCSCPASPPRLSPLAAWAAPPMRSVARLLRCCPGMQSQRARTAAHGCVAGAGAIRQELSPACPVSSSLTACWLLRPPMLGVLDSARTGAAAEDAERVALIRARRARGPGSPPLCCGQFFVTFESTAFVVLVEVHMGVGVPRAMSAALMIWIRWGARRRAAKFGEVGPLGQMVVGS